MPFDYYHNNFKNYPLDEVYWVDRNLASVFHASKQPGNTSLPTAMRTNLPKLRDIAIYDKAAQPTDEGNPCGGPSNGDCGQLCFAFPRDNNVRMRCDCAIGKLASDQKSCKNVDEYLVFATRTEIRWVLVIVNSLFCSSQQNSKTEFCASPGRNIF